MRAPWAVLAKAAEQGRASGGEKEYAFRVAVVLPSVLQATQK